MSEAEKEATKIDLELKIKSLKCEYRRLTSAIKRAVDSGLNPVTKRAERKKVLSEINVFKSKLKLL